MRLARHPADNLAVLRRGAVIPAHPLALTPTASSTSGASAR